MNSQAAARTHEAQEPNPRRKTQPQNKKHKLCDSIHAEFHHRRRLAVRGVRELLSLGSREVWGANNVPLPDPRWRWLCGQQALLCPGIELCSDSQNVHLMLVQGFPHQGHALGTSAASCGRVSSPLRGPGHAGCGVGTPSPCAASKALEASLTASCDGADDTPAITRKAVE